MESILIAYFMRKGHRHSASQRVADDIATALLEKEYSSVEYAITPIEDYPVENPSEFDAVVRMEKARHLRPALTHRVGLWKNYKTVIIVAPNWDGDMPMGVYSFLDDYDFNGKRIIPVIVHSGDGGVAIRKALRDYMPMCDVLDGVDIAHDEANDDREVARVVAATLQ